MKTPQNQKAEILQQFERGEISLQELKAGQLGIGPGQINFTLKGFESEGCLDPVQIDELVTSDKNTLFALCEGAYFYTPLPGSVIIILGQIKPDADLLQNAPRKPSDMAFLSVMENLGLGTRSPQGWTPEEEESHNHKIELEISKMRKSLKTILKRKS